MPEGGVAVLTTSADPQQPTPPASVMMTMDWCPSLTAGMASRSSLVSACRVLGATLLGTTSPAMKPLRRMRPIPSPLAGRHPSLSSRAGAAVLVTPGVLQAAVALLAVDGRLPADRGQGDEAEPEQQ